MKCCVCSKDRPKESCVIIQLTEAEKASVQAMGQKPEEQYVYCRPCFRVLSNPEQGAQLIRGVFQHSLQAEGVQNAEQLARTYYEFLVRKAKMTPKN